MSKKKKRPVKVSKAADMMDAIEQQKSDLRANITLLSGWAQIAEKQPMPFIFGIPEQEHAIHVRPGTKGFLIVQDLIQAELEQQGIDLIKLGGTGNE